eukprot:CAMPEP_0116131686 /NCGR_PEP_ID=MMETSP0329-20121206/9142_1 /TAXON_ID=697910 /ORGANISM="Pseudo-nitzschia arenysensis, Strain B593" /LENGTH=434 /DNA_ID=CAMNT_0003626141 /DNA_START=96 /DNA_END=1397 /DNA_ORIENTATION=+
MGLLVKPPSLSVLGRRSSTNQDTNEIHLAIERFSTLGKNRGRSKRRWKNQKQKRRRRHEAREGGQEHGYRINTGGVKIAGFKSQRIVLHDQTPNSDTDTMPSEGTLADDNMILLSVGRECIDDKDTKFHRGKKFRSCNERETVEYHQGDSTEKAKGDSFGRLYILSRVREAQRSSHSRSNSTFAKMFNKFGQNRRLEVSSASTDHKSLNKSLPRRPSTESTEIYHSCSSSIFDFDEDDDDDDDDDYSDGEIHGTTQGSVSGREHNKIFDFDKNVEDEQLDPIFVSDELDSLNGVSNSFGTESDAIDDASSHDENMDDEARLDTRCKCDLSSENKERKKYSNFTDTASQAIKDKVGNKKVSIDGQSHQVEQKSLSRESETLLVRNHDKRNELAWTRCAARNWKQPVDFPISQSRRQESVEDVKDDGYAENMFSRW